MLYLNDHEPLLSVNAKLELKEVAQMRTQERNVTQSELQHALRRQRIKLYPGEPTQAFTA